MTRLRIHARIGIAIFFLPLICPATGTSTAANAPEYVSKAREAAGEPSTRLLLSSRTPLTEHGVEQREHLLSVALLVYHRVRDRCLRIDDGATERA